MEVNTPAPMANSIMILLRRQRRALTIWVGTQKDTLRARESSVQRTVHRAKQLILSGIHEKAGQCQVCCVNLSPSFSRLGYPRFSPCPTALLSGGYTRGRQPSCGGSRQHRCMLACFLLAGSVLPAWGEPAPPRLALGGNGLPTICQVFFEGLVPFRVASKRGKP